MRPPASTNRVFNRDVKQKSDPVGDGSVEIAARILKSYFDEFCDSVQNNKSGPGFQNSTLYYMAKPYILQRDDFVNMKVPEWLQNSMSAVENCWILRIIITI